MKDEEKRSNFILNCYGVILTLALIVFMSWVGQMFYYRSAAIADAGAIITQPTKPVLQDPMGPPSTVITREYHSIPGDNDDSGAPIRSYDEDNSAE